MGEINEPGNHPVAWKAAQARDVQAEDQGQHPTHHRVRECGLGSTKNKGNSVLGGGNSKCNGWKV